MIQTQLNTTIENAGMNEIRIAVCDDEEMVGNQLKELILRQKRGCYVQIFASGQEFLDAKEQFDLIFMDIQMDGTNGIEAARIFRKENEEAVLIFVTGLKEYVFEAFDVEAFHYLLKPIDEDRFVFVFQKALSKILKRKEPLANSLFIKTKKRNLTLNKEDIIYIESRSKKVAIHTASEIVEVYGAIGEFEESLGESFCRCHRGYLVHLGHITEYENDVIYMDNGDQVYLSKRKYSDFVKSYMRYLRNGGMIGV